MTSLAQQAVLLSVIFLCGCQSLESLVPWQSTSTPNYTAEELAALESTPVASARAAGSNQSPATDGDSAQSENGIVQASYSPDAQAAPVSAQRIDQLVRSGQRIIGSGQKDPGKLAEARNYFEQALALDQRNSSAHHGMAIVSDLQHDYPTAEFHYKQALSANPSDPDLLNDLGYSYVLQNRFAEASNYLNRVLQISPQHERAKVNMALMSLKRGNRLEAQQILGSVYSPADAQATLVKLDESLQSMQVPAPPGGQVQSPQMAMNSQPGIIAPTENGVAQDVLKRMQQERERAEATRQQQTANITAVAQNQPPIHVYPPGFEDEPAVPNMATQQQQQQNMAGSVANYGEPQQQWANNGGIPGFPQSLNQNGSLQPTLADYQNMQPAQLGGEYSNQQFQNQMPQGQYPGSQPQGMVQQFGGGQPVYQNSMPAQQYQIGQQQPLQNPSSSMGAYGGQAQSIGMPNSPQNAPLAGLNAGPGALFPIGMPQTQQQQQNIYQQPVQQGTNYLPPQSNGGRPYLPHGSGNPQMIGPAGSGYGPQTGQSQMQPGPQYQYNTSTVSAAQPLNQNWQTQQYPQPQFNQRPMGQGQNQSAPVPSSDPLEAYERQLQSLDNQYNRAVQQMDGNGLGMSPMPSAQY